MKPMLLNLLFVLSTASGASAASGAGEDHSGIAVWVFLIMCALIVIAQLAPTILLLLGFSRGVAGAKKKVEHAS